MQHAEHRDAGADGDGQDDGDREREQRLAAETSKPDSNVSNDLAEPLMRPDVADVFLGLLQSSELDANAPPRIGLAHAAGDIVGDLALDVIAQLEIEALVGRGVARTTS